MRWWVFAIMAYLMLGLQVSLAEVMVIDSRFGPVEPRFVLLLAVFVGLYAPAPTVTIAWSILGLLLDLTNAWPLSPTHDLTLIGPYTLGYMAGAYVVLQTRNVLVRHHPLAIASMMIVCGAAVQLIVVAVFTARAWYEPLQGWSATSQLMARMLGLFYSAAIGAILAVPMSRMASLFGFQAVKSGMRRSLRR